MTVAALACGGKGDDERDRDAGRGVVEVGADVGGTAHSEGTDAGGVHEAGSGAGDEDASPEAAATVEREQPAAEERVRHGQQESDGVVDELRVRRDGADTDGLDAGMDERMAEGASPVPANDNGDLVRPVQQDGNEPVDASPPRPASTATPVPVVRPASNGQACGVSVREQFVCGYLAAGVNAHHLNHFLVKVIPCESSWNPNVVNGSGHRGLTQFSGTTWASVANRTGYWDWSDPWQMGFNSAVLTTMATPQSQWSCW